jgi:hypothetical protein
MTRAFVNFGNLGYKIQRLDWEKAKKIDVFAHKFLCGEFMLGLLWDIQCTNGHVCCFCHSYVFDSNLPTALNLNHESMNFICDAEFVCLKSILYFHKRYEKPFDVPLRKRGTSRSHGNKKKIKL